MYLSCTGITSCIFIVSRVTTPGLVTVMLKRRIVAGYTYTVSTHSPVTRCFTFFSTSISGSQGTSTYALSEPVIWVPLHSSPVTMMRFSRSSSAHLIAVALKNRYKHSPSGIFIQFSVSLNAHIKLFPSTTGSRYSLPEK